MYWQTIIIIYHLITITSCDKLCLIYIINLNLYFKLYYRLYNYDIDNKTLSLIEESLDCTYCILKILKIQLNMCYYVLTTDTKGFIHFWDVSKYIDNGDLKSTSTITPKFKHKLHQSGINCCDYLELENNYGLLATGGDDQHLNLSIFYYKDTVVSLCNVSISVHCSQVTGY